MEHYLKKFIYQSIITTIICLVATYIIKTYLITKFTFTEVYFLIPFVTIITLLFHILLVKAARESNMLFVNKFLAFSGLKLMIYLLTIIIYIFFIKFEPVVFLLTFAILYIIYTVIEITSLLKFFKKI